MARLLFRDSQGREGAVELTPTEPVFVGRGLECAIRTDDGMVSRRHSTIRLENGRYVVEDLGSANGTHLNQVRVMQKQALGHNDVIQCGSLMLRFMDEGGINIVQQPNIGGASPPAKKGGTMVLERNEAPAMPGGGPAAGFGGAPAMPGGLSGMGNPPSMSPPSMAGPPGMGPGGSQGFAPPAPSGFGGTAGGGAAGFGPGAPSPSVPPQNNLPYGGPPGMPGGPPADDRA